MTDAQVNRFRNARLRVHGEILRVRDRTIPAERITAADAARLPNLGNEGAGHGPAGYHASYTITNEDDITHTACRVGAMMFEDNIGAAFDYFDAGMVLAMPACTIPPFNILHTCILEEVFSCARVACFGTMETAVDDVPIVMLAGQAFAVGLPDAMIMSERDANAAVIKGAKALASRLSAEQRTWLGTAFPRSLPWSAEAGLEVHMEVEGVRALTECMAVHMSSPVRTKMMSTYVGLFLAYSQQGNITTRKLNKIIQDLAGQGITVALTAEDVRQMWILYGPYFNDDMARVFFPRWQTLFEQRSMRLRLIMSQAVWTGLTGYRLVTDMIATYLDFYWVQLSNLLPDEWARFVSAVESIDGDEYAGYRKNMDVLSVRNYASIVYCAKQLRLRVMGDQNMTGLATISTMTIKNAPEIDSLVDKYKAMIAKRAIGNDRTAALRYFGGTPVPAGFSATVPEDAIPAVNLDDLFNRLMAMRQPEQ